MQLSGRADVWRAEGALSGIPFIVLLYNNLVGVVISGHVTKMVVTPFDSHHSIRHCRKPRSPIMSLHLLDLYAEFIALSSVRPELFPIEILHCGIRKFRAFSEK